MPIDFNRNSRFRRTPPTLVPADPTQARLVETVGTWRQPGWLVNRPAAELIHTHRVESQHEGRPDLIAAALYGESELDWVLIAFNGARAVLNWPRTGAIIEYPDESLVVPEL